MLFSNVLLMLSASPRMSGFIYQVGLLGLKLQGVRCKSAKQIVLIKFESSASFELSAVMQTLQAGNQGLALPCARVVYAFVLIFG